MLGGERATGLWGTVLLPVLLFSENCSRKHPLAARCDYSGLVPHIICMAQTPDGSERAIWKSGLAVRAFRGHVWAPIASSHSDMSVSTLQVSRKQGSMSNLSGRQGCRRWLLNYRLPFVHGAAASTACRAGVASIILHVSLHQFTHAAMHERHSACRLVASVGSSKQDARTSHMDFGSVAGSWTGCC